MFKYAPFMLAKEVMVTLRALLPNCCQERSSAEIREISTEFVYDREVEK